MVHDLIVRGGTVIDGTGRPGSRADVAIDGDRVVAVGKVDDAARRTIDADGALVTPGFVDLHSHFDAQIGWDPLLSSSCWHGVTSVLMGNCGMSFAPLRPGDSETLARMMESVEDIPGDSIIAGLGWDWESYGEYLDAVDALPKGINVAGMAGHVALRYYVMGERSIDDDSRPTDDELAELTRLADEALAAGAFGISTSRSIVHRVPDGRFVPGTFADERELLALGAALARHPDSIFEGAPRFSQADGVTPRIEEELDLFAAVSRASGRRTTFNLSTLGSLPGHWKVVLERSQAANATGAQLRPQTTPRAIGVLFSLAASTPWDRLPSWAALRDLDLAARLAAVRDASRRAVLIAEADAAGGGIDELYLMTPERGARYELDPDNRLGVHAARSGRSPAAEFLALVDRFDGAVILNWPVQNTDFAAIEAMLDDPNIIMGLADAGAHATQIMDASQATFFLQHWVVERKYFTIEEGVRRITSDTAGFLGLADRGVLRPGACADVNVLDLDALHLDLPEIVHDFPGAAPRYVQRCRGIDATVVNGKVFMEHGEHTGALAGRLLRRGAA
jgi:N-acyl-D-aspartate/D-glutamate deacylase